MSDYYRIMLDDVERELSYGRRGERATGLNASLLEQWRASQEYPFRNQKGRPWTMQEHVDWKLRNWVPR